MAQWQRIDVPVSGIKMVIRRLVGYWRDSGGQCAVVSAFRLWSVVCGRPVVACKK